MFSGLAGQDSENEFMDSEMNPSTIALIDAIIHNQPSEVIEHLKAGANVNTLISDDGDVTTPLGIAVFHLNFKITQILLEHGANPNFDSNASLIERIMIKLGFIELDALQGLKKKHSITLLNSFTLSVPVKITITSDVINTCHKILDLLLCYDLKPVFNWSNQFEDSLAALSDTLAYHNKTKATEENSLAEIDAMNPGIHKIGSQVIMRGFIYALHLKNAVKNPAMEQLANYLLSISQIQSISKTVSLEIMQEKNNYQQEIDTNLKSTLPHWPLEITDTITSYIEPDIAKETARARLAEYRTVQFWKAPPSKAPHSNVVCDADPVEFKNG